jgi:hypothetical protein
MKSLKQLKETLINIINEESASGHSHKRIVSWINANGYRELPQHGKHPKFEHTVTKHIITSVNVHNKDSANGVRGIITAIKTHHNQHGLSYIPLDSKIDSLKNK